MKKLMIVIGMAALAAGAFADASLGYQGTLCDASGTPVASQEKQIEFRLYNSAEAAQGDALWARKYAVRTGANGVFNVELSDVTGTAVDDKGTGLQKYIAQCAKKGDPIYVGLLVQGSSGEIAPRQKLISAPYATYANDVSAASGDFAVAGTLNLAGGIRMSDTNSYVTAGHVTASTLTSTGNVRMDGTVTATQKVEAQNGLTVSGAFTANSAATFKDSVTVNGALDATTVKQDGNVLIPRGVIVMWSGKVSEVPAGWALCDGEVHDTGNDKVKTPNLKGQFIVGASTDTQTDKSGEKYGVNATGGVERVTLTTEQMPRHSHRFSRGRPTTVTQVTSGYHVFADEDVEQWLSLDTEAQGGDEAHENRPPFYALAYIMKL